MEFLGLDSRTCHFVLTYLSRKKDLWYSLSKAVVVLIVIQDCFHASYKHGGVILAKSELVFSICARNFVSPPSHSFDINPFAQHR